MHLLVSSVSHLPQCRKALQESRLPENSLRPTRDQVISLVSDLVSIDSVNPSLVPGAAGERRIAGFVSDWLTDAGLHAFMSDATPGRPNVVGWLGSARPGKTLMLNAHMDTVGVAGMAQPFTPRVEGDQLYGRGAYDMKGSLAAVMLAAQRLACHPDRTGQIVVTGVADEEYASVGTQAVVRDLRADAAIVTEPTGLRLCTAHRGFAWISIETHGRAAHGSKPDLGVDAIAHMGRVLSAIECLSTRIVNGPAHPLLAHGSIHASLIEGGQELSSYPEMCSLKIERRTVPGDSSESVLAEVQTLLSRLASDDSRFQGRAELLLWRDPFEIDRDEGIVRVLADVAANVLGSPPEMYGDTPWMDSALLWAAGIPTVVFGPGGGGAHAVSEWVSIEQVAQCAEILAQTVLTFCAIP